MKRVAVYYNTEYYYAKRSYTENFKKKRKRKKVWLKDQRAAVKKYVDEHEEITIINEYINSVYGALDDLVKDGLDGNFDYILVPLDDLMLNSKHKLFLEPLFTKKGIEIERIVAQPWSFFIERILERELKNKAVGKEYDYILIRQYENQLVLDETKTIYERLKNTIL